MERKGIPTIGKFGEVMTKHHKKTIEEAKKLLREGKEFTEFEEE